MPDREVSFIRHGDEVVWVTTENGVTTTRTEHDPLQHNTPKGNQFLRQVLQELDAAQPQIAQPPPLVIHERPIVVATPVPPRTTVVKYERSAGETTRTIQHGAPFTGGQFLLGVILLVGVMAWVLLLVRKRQSVAASSGPGP